MDAERFDTLVRAVSAGATRRGLLTGLAGGTGALLALAGAGDGAARKRRKKKRKKNQRRTCPRDFDCRDSQNCIGGRCVCDETLCANRTNPGDPQQECFCDAAADGERLCFALIDCAAGPTFCTVDGGCPAGLVCQIQGCSGDPTCVPLCLEQL